MKRYTIDAAVLQRWQSSAQLPDSDGNDYHHPDRTRLALFLGIVSLFLGPCGLIAFLVGDHCLKSIAAGLMDPSGESNARLGRLLGIVALCMFTLKVTAAAILIFVFNWPITWTL
jgi:hypothetical protein